MLENSNCEWFQKFKYVSLYFYASEGLVAPLNFLALGIKSALVYRSVFLPYEWETVMNNM